MLGSTVLVLVYVILIAAGALLVVGVAIIATQIISQATKALLITAAQHRLGTAGNEGPRSTDPTDRARTAEGVRRDGPVELRGERLSDIQ
jgi:hypothetical protein